MSHLAQQWLQLINDARAQSRYCGEAFYPAGQSGALRQYHGAGIY
ncbi:hypothetical protein O5O45_13970 [Hahella aquimaris]|nr:hypothetical protein [Hahella sp. HNIBRBA332]WLQ17022.1 hypothetical protein O5O45_13970 [Hahella sp. HNIBRBA332]